MRQGRNFLVILSTLAIAGIAQAAAPVPVANMVAKPIAISALHVTVLKAALLRPEALALRTNIRTISIRQPDVSKRIDLAVIDKSRVPVLVLPTKIETLRVITRSDHYTAISQLGNAVVTIDGTRTIATLPAGARLPTPSSRIILRTMHTASAPAVTDSLEGVRVERTMAGVSMSFVRFGHLYDLSIDCPDAGQNDPEATTPDADDAARIRQRFGTAPQGPSQCTQENALKIARQLEVLGGGAQ